MKTQSSVAIWIKPRPSWPKFRIYPERLSFNSWSASMQSDGGPASLGAMPKHVLHLILQYSSTGAEYDPHWMNGTPSDEDKRNLWEKRNAAVNLKGSPLPSDPKIYNFIKNVKMQFGRNHVFFEGFRPNGQYRRIQRIFLHRLACGKIMFCHVF